MSGLIGLAVLGTSLNFARGQEMWRFVEASRLSHGAVRLQFVVPTNALARLETAEQLPHWKSMATLRSVGTNIFTDTQTDGLEARFYRVAEVTDPTALTGDHWETDAGDAVIHPINHASLVIGWAGKTIAIDPVGGAGPYQGLPRADLVLVTHGHSDHLNAATIEVVRAPEAIVVAPAAVYSGFSAALRARTIPLSNDASTNVLGLTIEAVPAYNANHPRGTGNGYVLGLGGRRFYISGDTGDIPEMRALPEIDAAFLCMNVPFTMTVEQAAAAVRAFRPRVLYPYHYRNQNGTFADLELLRRLVAAEPDPGVEVRPRKWY